VPNRSSVDWPQAQFAPLYLAPGEPSFQPYSYLKNDVPLDSIQPAYYANNTTALTRGGHWQSGVGPGGDIAQLPFGGIMYSNPSHRRRRAAWQKRQRLLKRAMKAETSGRSAKARRRLAANKKARKLARAANLRRKANWARLRQAAVAAEATPRRWGWRPAHVTSGGYNVRSDVWHSGPALGRKRWGARPTNISIPAGIPKTAAAPPPEPIATAGLTPLYGGLALDNMGGLALDNMGGLALDNFGADCISCGDDYGEENWYFDDEGNVKWGPVLVTAGIALIATRVFFPGALPL
jgi:hypothetical protein